MTHEIEYLNELRRDLRSAASDARRPMQARVAWLIVAGSIVAVGALVTAIVVAVPHFRSMSERPSTHGHSAPTLPPGFQRGNPGALAIPTGPQLFGVSASSANDVWAVGQRKSFNRSLIEHFDGTSWVQTSHPTTQRLIGVAAISPRDAWAISTYQILHWNGAAWSRVHYPRPPRGLEGSEFAGISGSGADDVWIAGMRGSRIYGPRHNQEGSLTWALHWDGQHWRRVATPNLTRHENSVAGIDDVSPTDAWLVGGAAGKPRVSTTYHWNGSIWRREPSPDPGRYNDLWGVGDDGSGGVWAVGMRHDRYLRWTGTHWQPYASMGGMVSPTVMAGAAPDDLWAAGSEQRSEFMLAHSSGGGWSPADVTLPAGVTKFNAQLSGLVAVTTDDVWAVGWFSARAADGTPKYHSMALDWDGCSWAAEEVKP